jgi:hypothetical protein
MGGKRLGFSNFWEFLRLCWLFGWWASIGATLVATYILGNCWRCFLEQLEVGEKNPSDCYGLPTAAQISPPPPPRPHIQYMRARVYKLRDYLSWKAVPPPLAGISDLWWSPPPPPTPSWEEPPGVLGIRTGYLKINSVGISFRKIPASPRTCYTPSPSPPQLSWGGGDEARGVLPS